MLLYHLQTDKHCKTLEKLNFNQIQQEYLYNHLLIVCCCFAKMLASCCSLLCENQEAKPVT